MMRKPREEDLNMDYTCTIEKTRKGWVLETEIHDTVFTSEEVFDSYEEAVDYAAANGIPIEDEDEDEQEDRKARLKGAYIAKVFSQP